MILYGVDLAGALMNRLAYLAVEAGSTEAFFGLGLAVATSFEAPAVNVRVDVEGWVRSR